MSFLILINCCKDGDLSKSERECGTFLRERERSRACSKCWGMKNEQEREEGRALLLPKSPQLMLLTIAVATSELKWKFQFGHENFPGEGSLS